MYYHSHGQFITPYITQKMHHNIPKHSGIKVTSECIVHLDIHVMDFTIPSYDFHIKH